MWIHDHPHWYRLTWNSDAIAEPLAQLRHRQGLLLGRMAHLGFDLKQEATLATLTTDTRSSSAIEGEHLNTDEVHSSVARRLGVTIKDTPHGNRHVEGMVDMMTDATQNYQKPLTQKRLCHWHKALFPTAMSGLTPITVGTWRKKENDPMQVVSGAVGHEKNHFQAPPATRVEEEMTRFVSWFAKNNSDPILMAGMAHFWFVTIHPFEDGNGRIARAICDMALARADQTHHRFYSLSRHIEKQRKAYYRQLEQQQRNSSDITPWLTWFLQCLTTAIEQADENINTVIFKHQLWQALEGCHLNGRQRTIINRMMQDDFIGMMNTSKYAQWTQCSTDTALRDIQQLKAHGILHQNPQGGRSTSYRLLDDLRQLEDATKTQ